MIFNFRQSRDLEIDSSYSGAKAGKRKGKVVFYWSTSTYTTTTTTHSATYTITFQFCTPTSLTYSLCGAQSARIDQNDSKVNNSTTIGFSEKIVKHGMSIYAQTKSLLIYVYSVLVEFSRILF